MAVLVHDVASTGNVVVLLHSSAGDRRMWDPQWPGLIAARHRVVRCDLRGYGQTPAAELPGNDAEDVLELLDELGILKAAVVGASYGGRVALELAARWPARVRQLVLLSAGSPFHPACDELNAFDEQEESLVREGDLLEAAELNVRTWLGPEASESARGLLRTMQLHTYEVQLAAERQVERLEVPYELSSVTAHTLVVTGEHDFRYFRDVGRDLVERLTDARLAILPWGGHLPSLERPEEVLALLVDFLGAPA